MEIKRNEKQNAKIEKIETSTEVNFVANFAFDNDILEFSMAD